MLGIQTYIRKFNFNPKILKRVIAAVVIVAVAVTGVTVYLNRGKTKVVTQVQQTAKVAKGNLSISITGTATVASSSTANVVPKVAGTITKVYYNEGDVVKQGALLYEMDDSSARLDIEKIKNNIATAQLSNQDNLTSIGKLNITAPFSGILTTIPVKVGDTAAKGGTLATLVDKSKLKVTVPMKLASLNGVSEGGSAMVHVQSLMQSIAGTITMVTSPVTTSDGMYMVNLEVTVPNTGTLSEGLKANVELYTGNGSVYSTDTGSLAYINSSTIKTDNGGTVTQLNFSEGQAVSAGDTIMTLYSSDLQLTKQTNDIKMKDLLTQLDTAEKQLDDYKVYSTIDGTITSQSLHVGDAVKVADVTTKIANVKDLQCSVAIDELDIAKIKVGQKTNITADALSDTLKKPLSGAITSIGVSGTTTNGVTTYPVVVSVPYTDGIRPGMNVSLEIFVQDKQNTLYVPIEAIQKVGTKNYVYVKGGTGNGFDDFTKLMQANRQKNASGNGTNRSTSGSSSSSSSSANRSTSSSSSTNRSTTSSNTANRSTTGGGGVGSLFGRSNSSSSTSKTAVNYSQYYQNTTLKEVELGINNTSYIEILSGLSEGDEVVLPPSMASSSSQGNNAAGFGGGMGMMGGGGAPPQDQQRQQQGQQQQGASSGGSK